MEQTGFAWEQTSLPVAGKTPAARHSSSTGAVRASRDRGQFALVYRDLLITAGPLSDQEAARITGRQVSSICSTRSGWGERVVPSGEFEASEYGTKRTRWAWAKEAAC